jgi:predicted nuclease of predicted toxin-antitoxin system
MDYSTQDDGTICNYAMKNDMVVVTNDKDFAQRRSVSKTGPTIVWIRMPNTRRADLVRWFTAIFPNLLFALENGERMIEVV